MQREDGGAGTAPLPAGPAPETGPVSRLLRIHDQNPTSLFRTSTFAADESTVDVTVEDVPPIRCAYAYENRRLSPGPEEGLFLALKRFSLLGQRIVRQTQLASHQLCATPVLLWIYRGLSPFQPLLRLCPMMLYGLGPSMVVLPLVLQEPQELLRPHMRPRVVGPGCLTDRKRWSSHKPFPHHPSPGP